MDFERRSNTKKTSHKRKRKKKLPLWMVVLAVAFIGLIIFLAIKFAGGKGKAPSSETPASSLTQEVVSSEMIASVSSVAPSSALPASSSDEPESEAEPVAPELHFTQEEIDRLNGMLASWAALSEEGEEDGHNVSVYFMDIESGLEYVYNGERKYLIASLNKAPYAQYLYQLADEGVLNLAETIHVTAEMIDPARENSGRLKNDASIPRDMTIEELIYEMIRYSDTAALRILMGRYPVEGYRQFSNTLGLHFPEDVRQLTNARITALDAGVYLKALHSYMETGANGATLKEHMMGTRNIMIKSKDKTAAVARKYGWDISSYHDMAVVYTAHPYVLAILTDKSAGTASETAMFASIAGVFEEIMTAKWAELP